MLERGIRKLRTGVDITLKRDITVVSGAEK